MAHDQRQDDMTVREAGQRGGEKTAETHGREFYEEIGKKGGEVGGKKGGEARAAELGHEGYQELGHKGGQKVKELIEEGKRAQGEGSKQGNR